MPDFLDSGGTNVVCIVVDDLNAWIGALGRNPDVKTPNIDGLAERGALFTHAYCAAPSGHASRVATFTGRLPSSTGVYGDEPYWDEPGRPPTIVELLRAAGYYAFGAGKVFQGNFRYPQARRRGEDVAGWNDAENRLEVWDDFVVNGSDPLPPGRPLNGLFDDADLDRVPALNIFDWARLPPADEAEMPDELVTEAVTGFLAAPVSEPFFCVAGLYKPHLPWYVPDRYFDLYDAAALSLPPVKQDDLDDLPTIPHRWALTIPDHDLVTRHRQWRAAVHAYLASISYCDAMVGRILEAVEQSPARDRTAVVLLSDSGFHLGEKGHWRKFTLWEEATRVPLIMLLPGGAPPVRIHDPVSLVDVFPTLLEIAGLDADPDTDGESLLGAAAGTGEPRIKPAQMTWGRGNHSVRTRDWRYSRYRQGGLELYDHGVDGYEWTNLAGLDRYADVLRELSAWLPVDR